MKMNNDFEEMTLVEMIEWLDLHHRGISNNCFEDDIYPILLDKAEKLEKNIE